MVGRLFIPILGMTNPYLGMIKPAWDGDWKSVGVGLRVVVPLDINFYPIVLERRPK